MPSPPLTSLEICAGAGGQALGLEQAGFHHLELLEVDPWACQTLRRNRPEWTIVEADIHDYSPRFDEPLDLLSGGVPCPPFSVAGKRLGSADDRDLFPQALRLVEELVPKAVMIENVRGILDPIFAEYRQQWMERIENLGYTGEWRLVHASDFGVPQLRPRAVFVALRSDAWPYFQWPEPTGDRPPTVGEVLQEAMEEGGWEGAAQWAAGADGIAPTLVGGSKKHGGPDLGPTRAKKQWAALGVNAMKLADNPPTPAHAGMPELTVAMTAVIQGFPRDWAIAGRKTAAYRQVGNAFPPPVAQAIGEAIRDALLLYRTDVGVPVVEPLPTGEPVGTRM